MRVIRVHRCVESDTLQLPELREFIGKEVEIRVTEEPRRSSQEPAAERDYSALARIAGQDMIDPEAYQEFRAASMI
ncbi:MAG: hypothetical protein WCB27_23580 [Thermoguttaceae bacterium]|jgi:hypothetical protein